MPILKTYLYSDVARNGSVSASYPPGFSPDSFDKSGAKACLGSAETSLPADSYSLSWGASAVTVTSLKDTWTAGVSLFVSVPDVVNGQGEEVRAIVDPVTGRIKISGAGADDVLAATVGYGKGFDQYGRAVGGGNYAIPGFPGTQLVDLNNCTRTYTSAASDDATQKLGQKVNCKLVYNAAVTRVDLKDFGGAAGTVVISDTDVLTLNVYRPPSSNAPTVVECYFCNTASDFSNALRLYFMVEATGLQQIAIPLISFHVLGTFTYANPIAQIRFSSITAVTKECSPLANSASDYVLIGDIRKTVKTRPKILFTYDDNNSSCYTGWFPKLMSYGWVGTAFCVPTTFGLTGKFTLAQAKEMKAAGWTLGNHSNTHPANVGTNDGLRLLGPAGQVAVPVTNVDTVGGVFTVASGSSPTGYAAPVVFTGSPLPTGITAGVGYYPSSNSTSTTFKIYPTVADMLAGTNQIIPSTTGASVSFTYKNAAADSSAILADIQAAQTTLNANGLDGDYFAYPQAGHDGYTYLAVKAAQSAGLKFARGAIDVGNFNTPVIANKIPIDLPGFTTVIMDNRVWADNLSPMGSAVTLAAAIDISGGLTAAVQAAIDYVVSVGGSLCLLDHGYNAANATAVCDYVKKYELAGMLDVVTAAGWYAGRSVVL